MKKFVYGGIFIGSYIGSYIPAIWGDGGMFSVSGIIFSTIFSVIGGYVGKVVYERYF